MKETKHGLRHMKRVQVKLFSLNLMAVNVERTADILELDMDYLQYLPPKFFFPMGRTRNRLPKVAEYCFQQNYSRKPLTRIGVHEFFRSTFNHFAPFVQKIWVSIESAKYFGNETIKLSSHQGNWYRSGWIQ